MIILGVDPGLKHTGWCVTREGKPVDWGTIIPPPVDGRLQPDYVLGIVCPEILKLTKEYHPDYAAVEQVAYYGIRRSITLPLSHVAGGIVGCLVASQVPTALLLAAQRRAVKPWPGSRKWTEHERDAYALATVLRAARLALLAGDASTRRRYSAVNRRTITIQPNAS